MNFLDGWLLVEIFLAQGPFFQNRIDIRIFHGIVFSNLPETTTKRAQNFAKSQVNV
jgi:hypothetical protein